MLKAAFITFAFVVGVTMLAAVTSALIIFVPPSVQNAEPRDGGSFLMLGLVVISLVALLVGLFLSVFNLVLAALTLPPTLWAAHRFGLPRPMVDVAGGMSMGLLAASIGLGLLEGLRSKGNIDTDAFAPVIYVVGLLFGGATGYLRHLALGRPGAAQAALSNT